MLAASAPLAEKSAKICDVAAETAPAPATDAFMALAVSASESAMAAASNTTELRSEEGRQTAAAAAGRRVGLAEAEADAEEVDGANALRAFDEDEEEEVCNRRVVEAVDGRADVDAGAGCLVLDFADSADEDAEAGRERALLVLLLPAVAFICDDENTSDETATDATAESLSATAVVL